MFALIHQMAYGCIIQGMPQERYIVWRPAQLYTGYLNFYTFPSTVKLTERPMTPILISLLFKYLKHIVRPFGEYL